MNYTLEDIKKQSPYPIGELNTAYAKYFVGDSYLYPINDQEVHISNVTFEPGCRNNWHIHHGAAPESYFVHIAESVPNKNASNQWLEAVDEEEYSKLK